jgi:hypothetical protein
VFSLPPDQADPVSACPPIRAKAPKREAEKAAQDAEANVRAGKWKDPAAERITFGDCASRWYEAQDLAMSTMQNYRRHIEEHLLPAFEDQAVADILSTDVAAWEKRERAVPYAASSVKTWRATLHLILADAVEEGLRDANPATRRRGRGKRAGRSRNRGPEKAVTDALGILLIAERTSLLSGRDDEFAGVVTKGYTGTRFGEVVGLEAEFVRPEAIRVEWQLYELDTGVLHRCPPKDDSYRTVDCPGFLSSLIVGHIARTNPQPCRCHGRTYVFSGHGTANGAAHRPGAKLVDVARHAGVSAGTVSNVLNRPEAVAEATRIRVLGSIAELDTSATGPQGSWHRTGVAPDSRAGCSAGRHGAVSQAWAAGRTSCAVDCRAVAGYSGARARGHLAGAGVLGGYRTWADPARSAAQPQDADA